MKRHELTDEQWALVNPLIPVSTARTGRPPRDRRTLVNGIFWILNTGAPWRDLPDRFGAWQTVYHHFAKWRREGVFDIIAQVQIREGPKCRCPCDSASGVVKGSCEIVVARRRDVDSRLRGQCRPRYLKFLRNRPVTSGFLFYSQVWFSVGAVGGPFEAVGILPNRLKRAALKHKLREAEVLISQGQTVAQVCKQLGVIAQTYYWWRKAYGVLKMDQARRLKELEK